VKEKNYYKVSAGFFKNSYRTNSDDCSESRIKISFWLSLLSLVAGFQNHFQNYRRLSKQLLDSQEAGYLKARTNFPEDGCLKDFQN
jgi:hypothetical protein